MLVVAMTAANILSQNGLDVDWNGSPQTRILVNLEWQFKKAYEIKTDPGTEIDADFDPLDVYLGWVKEEQD
jgi:hypothetical protein